MKYFKWLFLCLITILSILTYSNLNLIQKYSSTILGLIKTNRYVVISTSYVVDKDPFDVLYVPVSVLAWRRLNIEPILFVTYGPNTTSHVANTKFAKVITLLLKMNVNIVYLGSVESHEYVIAQYSRLFGGLLPDHILQEEDFLFSSDAHIMPLSENFTRTDHQTGITLWNVTCALNHMCHIGMTKKKWRDMMQLNTKGYKLDGKSVREKLMEIYKENLNQIDQKEITNLLKMYADSSKTPLYLQRLTGERIENLLTRTDRAHLLRSVYDHTFGDFNAIFANLTSFGNDYDYSTAMDLHEKLTGDVFMDEINVKSVPVLTSKDVEHEALFFISPPSSFCAVKNLPFVGLVIIAPNRFEKRRIVRSTWGNKTHFGDKLPVFFVVGMSSDPETNAKINAEFQIHQDVLQLNFVDSYYKISSKLMAAFKWIAKECANAKYILRINDDAMVNTYALLNLFQNKIAFKPRQIYGWIVHNGRPVRRKGDKFYVDREDYALYYFLNYPSGRIFLFVLKF